MSETKTGGSGSWPEGVQVEDFRVLAEMLLPPTPGRPGIVDTSWEKHLGHSLEARPDLRAPLAEAVAAARSGMDALRELDDHVLEEITVLLIAVYFMAPQVRRSYQYRGQGPVPIAEGESEYYLDEGDLLAPVVGRGSTWRDPGPLAPSSTTGTAR